MRQLLPNPDDAPDLWQTYAYPAGGSWLRANMVASADGAAAWAHRSGALGGPADRRVFRTLRALADVVLVAAGTVRAEGYGPPRLPDDLTACRSAAGMSEQPHMAVVSGSLDLDWRSRLFTESTSRPLVITSAAADSRQAARAAEVADVLAAGDDRVDLRRAVAALAERGHHRLLTEGGPSLLGQLIAEDLLDELCLTVAPRLAGGGPPRIVTGPPAALVDRPLAGVLEQDGFLFLRYTRSAA
ncbi:MAG TPA: pyrimidine reductase family protein [Mycobacteriales bacterium]|nr:pyrimidine reductase family protein [Mycobacteriales bacterium]